MKVAIVVRLSRMTEANTSVDRQREVCEDFWRQRGWEPVQVITDTDISGAVDPFDVKKRPGLGGFLASGGAGVDVLSAYRCDRFTRNVRSLQALVNWAEDNGKLIVSATEPHFDTGSPFAAVLVALLGQLSAWELEAITERNRSTAQRNIELGK